MSRTRWIALTVRVPSEELADELAEGLVSLGGLAVEQGVDVLTTYVPEPADPDAFLDTAADRLTAIAGEAPELLWRWQDDEDWSARWKEGLEPRRVGDRIVVTQPWNPVEPEGDDVVIVIDPSSAFGTGEHPTTRGALRLLERAVTGGERVLDVGAGSAILGIAAVRLGAGSVLAVESDPGAIGTAAANIARAGVGDRIELVNAVVDAAYLDSVRERFDVIAANVLSGVLTPLLPGLRSALRPAGRVILGGIMTDEAGGVRQAAAAAGLEAAAEDREGEWWTALLRAAP
ncbi:MAG: 50S ribosomal protein L11 methyltransferase [Longimicrobiales bacterium]|nr:50S ribosomal protein L11 methyltransferase [Longimicrobiales bacterium]